MKKIEKIKLIVAEDAGYDESVPEDEAMFEVLCSEYEQREYKKRWAESRELSRALLAQMKS